MARASLTTIQQTLTNSASAVAAIQPDADFQLTIGGFHVRIRANGTTVAVDIGKQSPKLLFTADLSSAADITDVLNNQIPLIEQVLTRIQVWATTGTHPLEQ